MLPSRCWSFNIMKDLSLLGIRQNSLRLSDNESIAAELR